jgi:cob(I)alamin adenosyltransferase
MRIYTRKGDDGTTSLWYGGRVAKDDPRTEAYGAVDEANAALGAARALCGDEDTGLAEDLLRLQRELFVVGAELATSPEASERLEDGISRVTEQMVEELEPVIDRYMDQVELPPQFVIPGRPSSTSPGPRSAAPSGGWSPCGTAAGSPRKRCCDT